MQPLPVLVAANSAVSRRFMQLYEIFWKKTLVEAAAGRKSSIVTRHLPPYKVQRGFQKTRRRASIADSASRAPDGIDEMMPSQPMSTGSRTQDVCSGRLVSLRLTKRNSVVAPLCNLPRPPSQRGATGAGDPWQTSMDRTNGKSLAIMCKN